MFVILTIPRRIKLAELTKESLISVGVDEKDIEIIFGYDKLDFPDMDRPYLLVTSAFFNFILTKIIFEKKALYYVECGTMFKENPLNIDIDKTKINWLGYLFSKKSYICGVKCVYLPIETAEDMMKNKPKRLAHLDRYIRNYGIKKNKLIVLNSSIIGQFQYDSDWGTAIQIDRKKKIKYNL
jgi:hypothetical protein